MEKFDVVQVTLASDTGFGANFTVNYSTGKSAADYLGAGDHRMTSTTYPEFFASKGEFEVAFGATNMTVTNKNRYAMAAGTVIFLHLDRAERDAELTEGLASSAMAWMQTVKVALGAPDTLDADGAATAQAVASAGDLTLDGALATAGVVTFDVARAAQIVSSNAGDTTQTATITGTDEHGAAVVEVLTFNGTSAVLGAKAFKTITQIAISAALAGNGSAGSTDVLGLPMYLANALDVLIEREDGAAPTAGTFVAGDTATATGTTGDVRGTYDPNSACDGTAVFDLVALVASTSAVGVDQYAG